MAYYVVQTSTGGGVEGSNDQYQYTSWQTHLGIPGISFSIGNPQPTWNNEQFKQYIDAIAKQMEQFKINEGRYNENIAEMQKRLQHETGQREAMTAELWAVKSNHQSYVASIEKHLSYTNELLSMERENFRSFSHETTKAKMLLEAQLSLKNNELHNLNADLEHANHQYMSSIADLKAQLSNKEQGSISALNALEHTLNITAQSLEVRLSTAEEKVKSVIADLNKREQKLLHQLEEVEASKKGRPRHPPKVCSIPKDLSIALFGDWFYWLAPGTSCGIIPQTLTAEQNWGGVTKDVAFGTNDSWFQCWYNEDSPEQLYIATSDNFKDEYPELARKIDELDDSIGALECISLGPGGQAFMYWDDGQSFYALPGPMGDMIGYFKKSEVTKLWFGIEDSYVAVLAGGSVEWNLQGHYKGLENYLQGGVHGETKIKALALNPLDSGSLAVVWANGWSMAWAGEGHFPMAHWNTWIDSALQLNVGVNSVEKQLKGCC